MKIMEALQALPVEDWPILRDSLKRDWPAYAHYYNWAITAICWNKTDPDSSWKIYCPGGKYNAGAFLAVASNGVHLVIPFVFEESKDLLKKMIMETDQINWKNETIHFCIVHESMEDILKEAIEARSHADKINLAPIDTFTTINYFKAQDECLKSEWKVPNDCYVKSLNISHASTVHSVWPFRSSKKPESTLKYLGTLVRLNRCVGLFKKGDDSLVSWILQNDFGGLGMLQTVEGYERKGYAKIVTQILAKELAEKEGLDSTLLIVKDNVPSENLFNSLGYRPLRKVGWMTAQPLNV